MDPFALVRLSLGPRTRRRELLGNSGLPGSVRDRGVGGSNPLAPTNFPKKHQRIQFGRPLGFARVVSSSNRPSASLPTAERLLLRKIVRLLLGEITPTTAGRTIKIESQWPV